MQKEDKDIAESILRHLCIGRRICGINFYTVPVLLIDAIDGPSFEATIQLTIEAEWRVFDELPLQLPIVDSPGHIVDKRRTSELICAIGKLGWYTIIGVQLGENSPHLVLKFENGQFLYINGHHDQYESWNILAGEYQVVATPGDGIAIWHPEGFRRSIHET